MANRLFAIVANLPIGLPYSAAFRVSVQSMGVNVKSEGEGLIPFSHIILSIISR